MSQDPERETGGDDSRSSWLELAQLRAKRGYHHVRWRLRVPHYRWRELRERLLLIRRTGPIRYLRAWRDFRAEYGRRHSEHGERAKRGRLDAFAETGTEGFRWLVYEDDKSGCEGMVTIDKGDRLTIFRHDGAIVFDGIIDPDRKAGYQANPLNSRFGRPCAFGCWIHWTQRGWDVKEWAALFFHGEIVTDEHELLRRDSDAVPFRAIIVKAEKPQSDEEGPCDDRPDEEDNDPETG